MIYIIRNNQEYGPYDENVLLTYVNNGQISLYDKARDAYSSEINKVAYFLKKAKLKPKIVNGGNLFVQLKKIGSELIFPWKNNINKKSMSDQRLLLLALVGLFPTLLMILPLGPYFIFYIVSLYFACIWGLFFYFLFKTPQVKVKTTMLLFFATQAFVFVFWGFGLNRLNFFYLLTKSFFPLNFLGYVFGVGLTEEFIKALPLIIICKRAKEPIVPQTLLYYGLMSGIAFGVFEGVQYQMTVNVELDYTSAFFLNIARLTSLPFLHAIWCGIAGYFIAFAYLYPKYRKSLYFLAFMVPAVLHGCYDTFTSTFMFIAVIICFIGVVLLMTYLKQGVNYQSKLRN